MIMNWVKVTMPMETRMGARHKLLVPDTPGVYLLVNNDGEVVYVGMSNHLSRRAKQHRTKANRQVNYWDKQYFIYCECEDPHPSRTLEQLLIQKYCPVHNTKCKLMSS